jgi:hypothetical protein
MTGRVWLHDSAGAWLADVRDDGVLIADIAHAPGVFAPLSEIVSIEGVIERGMSLMTIHAARCAVVSTRVHPCPPVSTRCGVAAGWLRLRR